MFRNKTAQGIADDSFDKWEHSKYGDNTPLSDDARNLWIEGFLNGYSYGKVKDKYLFTNEELADMMRSAGLHYSTTEKLWKVHTIDFLQFIGKIEDAYIKHYERDSNAL